MLIPPSLHMRVPLLLLIKLLTAAWGSFNFNGRNQVLWHTTSQAFGLSFYFLWAFTSNGNVGHICMMLLHCDVHKCKACSHHRCRLTSMCSVSGGRLWDESRAVHLWSQVRAANGDNYWITQLYSKRQSLEFRIQGWLFFLYNSLSRYELSASWICLLEK